MTPQRIIYIPYGDELYEIFITTNPVTVDKIMYTTRHRTVPELVDFEIPHEVHERLFTKLKELRIV